MNTNPGEQLKMNLTSKPERGPTDFEIAQEKARAFVDTHSDWQAMKDGYFKRFGTGSDTWDLLKAKVETINSEAGFELAYLPDQMSKAGGDRFRLLFRNGAQIREEYQLGPKVFDQQQAA